MNLHLPSSSSSPSDFDSTDIGGGEHVFCPQSMNGFCFSCLCIVGIVGQYKPTCWSRLSSVFPCCRNPKQKCKEILYLSSYLMSNSFQHRSKKSTKTVQMFKLCKVQLNLGMSKSAYSKFRLIRNFLKSRFKLSAFQLQKSSLKNYKCTQNF